MPHCTARSKRTGQPCRQPAMRGKTVCRLHGGKSLAGPASPTWIDGRHSKVLPQRLLADYQATLADPERLTLTAELAIVDARLADVLRRVDAGESGRLWRLLRQSWRDFEAARDAGDGAAAAQALSAHGQLLARGHGDWAAWQDALLLIGQRKSLAESERKRAVEAQQVIGVEVAMGLLAQLVDAVTRHVREDAVLRAIVDEYARLVGRPSPAALVAGGASGRNGAGGAGGDA